MISSIFLVLASILTGIAVFIILCAFVARFSSISLKTAVRPALCHPGIKTYIRDWSGILSRDHHSSAARRIRLWISGIFGCLSFAAGGNIIFAFLLGAGMYVSIGWWYEKKKERERQTFDDQLIEALSAITTSVRTGQSLMQALETMAKESKPPLSQLFNDALAQARLGLPLHEALAEMANKTNSKELRIVVTALVLSRETGGNLGEIMQRIAETMRERKKIRGKIGAFTAQGKASGVIMSLVPAILLILLALIEPRMYGLLFTTVAGNIMLCVAALMIACGSFFIKKITSIDF